MKKTLCVIGSFLITSLFFSNLALAANTDRGSNTTPTQQQTQTSNQGEVPQIQTRTQSGEHTETPVGQPQNQEQQGYGQVTQLDETVGKGAGSSQSAGFPVSQQRRSQVANAVEEMLRVAERNGGIGEQVKEIAQNQVTNQEKLEDGLNRVQSRNMVLRFLIGPNYGEISSVTELMAQNREQISQLLALVDDITSPADRQVLLEQISVLEQSNIEVEDSLNAASQGFSLFGWLAKLFIK